MIPKRSDADAMLQDRINRESNELLLKVGDSIKREWNGIKLLIDTRGMPHADVCETVKRVLRESGWTATFNDSQRDGTWLVIT